MICMKSFVLFWCGGRRSGADEIIIFRWAKQKCLTYLLLNLNFNDWTLFLMIWTGTLSPPTTPNTHIHYIHCRYQIHIHFLVFLLYLCCFVDRNLVGTLRENCIIGPILSWQKESCKHNFSIYSSSSSMVMAGVPWRKPWLYGLEFQSVSCGIEMWNLLSFSINFHIEVSWSSLQTWVLIRVSIILSLNKRISVYSQL